MTSAINDYFLYALLGIYAIGFVRLFVQKVNLRSGRWLTAAFLCWPVFMLDEWLRMANATGLASIYGLSEVFAVIAITCCYRAIKPMLLAYPTARKRLWWPVVMTGVFQCAILLIPVDDKQQWLSSSPHGQPLLLWPAYIASLLTGFSVLSLKQELTAPRIQQCLFRMKVEGQDLVDKTVRHHEVFGARKFPLSTDSQGWQTVQQSMPLNKTMGPANYSAVEVMLRQTLWSGFLLGDLFVEERGNFRAPWLDLLTGIDELNALLMLKQSIDDAEVDSHDEVRKWTSEKLSTLIRIMERTRTVAMQRDVYW